MDTRNPYKTPEGYFEQLNAKILQNTIATKGDEQLFVPKREREVQTNYTFRSMMGFAAGFAIFVALAWGGFYLMVGDTSKSSAEFYADELYGIDDSALYDSILDTNDEFNEAAEEYLTLYSMTDTDILYE